MGKNIFRSKDSEGDIWCEHAEDKHLLTELAEDKNFESILDVSKIDLVTLECHSNTIAVLEVDKDFKLETTFHHFEKV